jgi:hypothetical protein
MGTGARSSMDRATGFYPVGWGFESLRAHSAPLVSQHGTHWCRRTRMKPRRVGLLVGHFAFVVSLAIMAAGSDRPPPPGFMIVAIACAGLGLLMGGLVPVMAPMQHRGRSGMALAMFAGGSAAYVGLVAMILVLMNGGTAGPGGGIIFLAVCGIVGALGGFACGALALRILRSSTAR